MGRERGPNCRRKKFFFINNNNKQNKQKQPRRGKTDWQAGKARLDKAGQGRAGKGTQGI